MVVPPGLVTSSGPSVVPAGTTALTLRSETIVKLAEVPLDFQPGTLWRYSGQAGFDVLSRIVEVASGLPFDRFLRERLFDPLGMKDTGFFAPPEPHGSAVCQTVAHRPNRRNGGRHANSSGHSCAHLLVRMIWTRCSVASPARRQKNEI